MSRALTESALQKIVVLWILSRRCSAHASDIFAGVSLAYGRGAPAVFPLRARRLVSVWPAPASRAGDIEVLRHRYTYGQERCVRAENLRPSPISRLPRNDLAPQMYEPVSDYAHSYSDVFQSPNPEEGGIYTLEEAGKDTDSWSGVDIRNRYANDLRMRERPQHPTRLPKAGKRAEHFSAREYAQGLPIEYPGRSARYDRPPVDNIMWDERPRSFRPNSDNLHAELYIPPPLRPWGGSGPSPYLAYPVESPSQAVSVIDRFSSGGGGNADNGAPQCCHKGPRDTFTIGFAEIVLFFVIIILLAMWVMGSTLAAKQASDIRKGIREALESLKK